MSARGFNLRSEHQQTSQDPISTSQMPPGSDKMSNYRATSPKVQDTVDNISQSTFTPTAKPTDEVIYKVMDHFKLYCTRPVRSLLLYKGDNRREDIQTTISLLRSRLQTAEDEALFYQLLRHLTSRLPWLAAAENRQRENIADRESLATLEEGWKKYLSQMQ